MKAYVLFARPPVWLSTMIKHSINAYLHTGNTTRKDQMRFNYKKVVSMRGFSKPKIVVLRHKIKNGISKIMDLVFNMNNLKIWKVMVENG
jgi:hypothetical protein